MKAETDSKVAVITGGSRGIGRAVVENLLDDGWRVYLCSRSASSLEKALEDLRATHGDRVQGRVANVREQEQVDDFIEWAIEDSGGVDCLVNNAGLGGFGSVDSFSGELWRELIETNLNGAFYCIRAVSPHMKARGAGWIVNMASLASVNPFAGGAAYNASKFGLLGLSDAAMLDLRQSGVRVTAIMPGSVDTDFSSLSRPTDRSWMLSPDDVARAVADFLRYPSQALPSRIELRPAQPP